MNVDVDMVNEFYVAVVGILVAAARQFLKMSGYSVEYGIKEV